MDLSDKEKEAWEKQGWTPEGAAHVSPKDLAESLGVPIGRAASIIARCKSGAPAADEVERALAGDAEARAAVSLQVRGLPWVALRNGKPDLAETRALVKDLKERPAQRATWKGLLVVQASAITSSASKLPRCQITGNVLDDYDGKLIDGVTGADWAPVWTERGNGRILWLAHGPRSLVPPYAESDPARAARELAEPEVPVQWRRLEASFVQASATEKAMAVERLYRESALLAIESAPPSINSGSPCAATSPGQSCPGFRGSCARSGEIGRCGLRIGGATMDRAAIRKRLEHTPDSEFMALCLDYFPAAYREFSAGMLKTEKINLLLQLVTPAEIAKVLR